MHSTRQAPQQPSVLGRTITARTRDRLAKSASAGLWDGNIFFAALMTAVIWIAIWNGFLGSAFWSGMPGEDGGLARLQLRISLGVGLAWGAVAGWWSYRYHNRVAADGAADLLGRQLALHRLHSIALGLFFALAAIVQAWGIDPRFGATTAAILLAELAAGYYFLPVLLRYLAGEYPRLWQMASLAERLLLGLLGGLAALNLFVPALLGQSNHFLAALAHLICVIFVPWLPALAAWALIHFRSAGQARADRGR
jgi:hypothetical protein